MKSHLQNNNEDYLNYALTFLELDSTPEEFTELIEKCHKLILDLPISTNEEDTLLLRYASILIDHIEKKNQDEVSWKCLCEILRVSK
jgi:hypothetical protein